MTKKKQLKQETGREIPQKLISQQKIDISYLQQKSSNPGYLDNYFKKGEVLINDKIDGVHSLLHLAAKNRDEAVVRELLEKGSNVNMLTDPDRGSGNPEQTALGLVIEKLNNSSGENFAEVQSLLLDYGADHKPIGDRRQKQKSEGKTIEKISEEYGLEAGLRARKKELENDKIVKECAKGREDLEKIYIDFYNLLQSKLSSTIDALRVASADILTREADTSTKVITAAGEKILASIPVVGATLGTGFSGIYNFFASKKQLEDFQKKAAYFTDHAHIDEVSRDFAARMTEYYKEALIAPDLDMSIIKKFKLLAEGKKEQVTKIAREKIISLSEDKPPAQKDKETALKESREKMEQEYREGLIAKAVLKFVEFLRDSEINYAKKDDLGIEAAKFAVPGWPKELRINPVTDFNLENAKNLALVAQLAYEGENKIKEVIKNWGFNDHYIKTADSFRSLVLYDNEKMIIAFRGTHHPENWVNVLNISGRGIEVKGKKINVHGGFYEALDSHWQEGADNQEQAFRLIKAIQRKLDKSNKPDTIGQENQKNKFLKEIIEDYLNKNENAKIYLTGHSLGGGVAGVGYCKLLGLEIGNNPVKASRVALYSYGNPAWCQPESLDEVSKLAINCYRIVNHKDPLPNLPGCGHIGLLCYIDKEGKIILQGSGHSEPLADLKNLKNIFYFEQNLISNYARQLIESNESDIKLENGRQGLAETVSNEDKALGNKSIEELSKALQKDNKQTDEAKQKVILKLMEEMGYGGKAAVKEETIIKEEKSLLPGKKKPEEGGAHKKAKNLYEAAAFGELEAAKLLIKNGAEVNAKSMSDYTPLLLAAEKGHLELAKLLLDQQAEVNAKGRSDYTSLHLAAEKGHLELVMLLIDQQAEVNAKGMSGHTPLHLTAGKGHLELAKLLIDQQAEVNAKCMSGYTPLHSAAIRGHLELAKLLIDHQAEVNAKGRNGDTPLHFAAKPGHLELAKLLIDQDNGCQIKDLDELAGKSRNTELAGHCYYAYGLKVLNSGNHAEAKKAFTSALKYFPYSYSIVGKFSKYAKSFKMFSLSGQYQEGIEYLLQNQPDKALKIFGGEQENSEAKPGFLFGKALSLIKSAHGSKDQKLEEAQKTLGQYRSLINNESMEAEYWYGMAELMMALGYEVEALKSYQKVLLLNGDFLEAIFGIGNLYRKAGNLEKAKECFDKVKESDLAPAELKEQAGEQAASVYWEELASKEREKQLKAASSNAKLDNNLNQLFNISHEKEGLRKKLSEHTKDLKEYDKVIDQLEYGHKLLAGENIPKNLKSREDKYFSKINNIIKDLDKLKTKLNKSKIEDSIKAELILKIEQVRNYYDHYVNKFLENYKGDKLLPAISGEQVNVLIEDGREGFLNEEAESKLTITKPTRSTAQEFGIHTVVSYKGVHYKHYPHAPGIEFAVNALHNLILDGRSVKIL